MSHNSELNALLIPSHILDPYYYSVDFALFQLESLSSSSTSYSDDSTNTSSSMSMSSTPISKDNPPILAPLPVHKPPLPTLPHPYNITAYTKPGLYRDYIKNVLELAPVNAARISLNTIVNTQDLAQLREYHTYTVANIVNHDFMLRQNKVSLMWIHEVLFPSSIFPPNFSRKLREDKFLWDPDKDKWTSSPESLSERCVKDWLNWVATNLGNTFGLFNQDGVRSVADHKEPDLDRSWDDSAANKPPTGGSFLRKPDICLLNREVRSSLTADERPSWPVILAFVEVTKRNDTFNDVVKNIVEKAFLMFETQPFRRYVIALGIFGPPKDKTGWQWTLVLVDRAGVICTDRFSINHEGGLALARVIYALCFARPTDIGIDETMTVDKYTGRVTHITVTGQTSTSGPNSKVKKNSYYILKDSWPLQSHSFSEIEHLIIINQKIQEDENAQNSLRHTYPIFYIAQDFDDSTNTRREFLKDKPVERDHRRIVTKNIGDPLTSFRSKYELCSILIDVVKFLKFSTEVCKICHGDISLNNIVINRVWGDDKTNSEGDYDDVDDDDPSPQDDPIYEDSNNNSGNPPSELPSIKSYGLSIDNDSSFALDGDKNRYHINSGTIPYMALDALKWKKPSEFTHKPHHDLESLFYVILTICTYTTGPSTLLPMHDRLQVPELSICLNEWWDTYDRHRLARTKAAALSCFDEYILNRLPSYWVDFHPVLKELYLAIWPQECSLLQQDNIATHTAFLRILGNARQHYESIAETGSSFAFILPPMSQIRKNRDSDAGDEREKKSARRKDNKHGKSASRPHALAKQHFSNYVDSGAPSTVTRD